ncbi:hypothetical protein LSAT2_012893, partial [Lamellibrachia satsuma]
TVTVNGVNPTETVKEASLTETVNAASRGAERYSTGIYLRPILPTYISRTA